MSIQEIEKAISQLSPSEIDQLTAWIKDYRSSDSTTNGTDANGASDGMTLAQALGSFIGAVGDPKVPKTSTAANASELFGEYLTQKKREGRL